MVRFGIDDVNEDMVLGESIILPTGELLLAAGYRVKERYRDRLRQLGYSNVLINVAGTEGVVPESIVSEKTQREMQQSIEISSKDLSNAFQQFKLKSSNTITDIINQNRQYLGKFLMNSGMIKALDQFVDEIMGESSIVLNLSALQSTKSTLLDHALNVAITSLCIGKKYKFSYDEMKQLGIGALNYDLGMIVLPPEIITKKREQYTDEEAQLYRQHTVFGFLLLSQNHAIPSTSAAVALQHHEREDGAGYPRGLKGDNRPPLKDFSRQNMIHRFAEIVSVADTYNMLTVGRNGETEKLEIRSAIRKIIGMGGTLLNTDIVKALISIVPLYPIGSRVRIVDAPTPQLVGYYGVVAKDNASNLEEPQVILFETKNRQRIKPVIVDLSKHKGFVLELVT